MTADERFMRRALDLARLGAGQVAPNPLVGCVVVRDGQILGEGWHQRFGGPHAEANAVGQHTHSLAGATVYVTLEPCAHHGKTPPCADLLVAARVARVVVANPDPNPLVAGRGLARLQAAGIEVTTHVLAADGARLNRRFFTLMAEKRPYVVLKWAQTADGFLAPPDRRPRWISGPPARRLVHRWRTEEAAILVGGRTALNDNPRLTARHWSGPSPLRVVLDQRGDLPRTLHLFDGTVPTLCYTPQPPANPAPGVTYVPLEANAATAQVLTDLGRRGVASLLVEGGAQTLHAFLESGCWDEARVFTAPVRFGDGVPAPRPAGAPRASVVLGPDRLQWFEPA